MHAGFAQTSITPPMGTRMMGFGSRDREQGCSAVHDDISARGLYLRDGSEQALIIGLDLCFIGRVESDRFKGAIGRHLDMLPRQILLNASHSHAGPAVGIWHDTGFIMPDRLYLEELERAVVAVACEAREAAQEVTLHAGSARTSLPMNRRTPTPQGMVMAPNPAGPVYDAVPICLLQEPDGRPVCLLFSVSCHPVIVAGFEISAEYPGAAIGLLNERLGGQVSLFLQGVGADANPGVMGPPDDPWRNRDWETVARAGRMVAEPVWAAIEGGLKPVAPRLRGASVELSWPLQPIPDRTTFEAIAADPKADEAQRMWARGLLERLDRGQSLPTAVTLTLQGIGLGEGLRLIGIEGEATAGLGRLMNDFFGGGITFPLGYCNGEGLYLPTSDMIVEGGYEVDSYWEYGPAAPLAVGFEERLVEGLAELRRRGVK